MPESSIRQFAIDILRGLSYSHCQGVIYSDLKPANVLIAEHGQLKLSNFGQAQRVKDISEQPAGRSAHDGTQSSKPPSLVRARGRASIRCAFCAVRRNRREKQARNSVLHGAGALSGPISGAVQHSLMRQWRTCACARVRMSDPCHSFGYRTEAFTVLHRICGHSAASSTRWSPVRTALR